MQGRRGDERDKELQIACPEVYSIIFGGDEGVGYFKQYTAMEKYYSVNQLKDNSSNYDCYHQ